jgi:hypothetical protein
MMGEKYASKALLKELRKDRDRYKKVVNSGKYHGTYESYMEGKADYADLVYQYARAMNKLV